MKPQSETSFAKNDTEVRQKIAICVSKTWLTYRAFSPCGFLLHKMHEGFDHFIIDPNGGDEQVGLIQHIKCEYDCIVSCEYSWQYIGEYKGLKVIIVDDLHRWGRHRLGFDEGARKWADLTFSTYHFTDCHPNYPGSVPTELRRNYIYFPHFTMDVNVQLPEYEERRFAVVPGASVENFYPVRALAKRLPNVEVPGKAGLQELSREEFILQLSKFKVAITCNLTLRYVVAKYFEIPMAGTALIASDIPHPFEKYLLGFDSSNSFFIPFSKEEDSKYIGELAEHAASDREQWSEMTRKGRDLVRSRHTPIHRYRYLYSIINRALSGQWTMQDQYDHFIASWSSKQIDDELEQHNIDKPVSFISVSGKTFPETLILEPSNRWWSKFFSPSDLIRGSYISNDPRIYLEIPKLSYLTQYIGTSSGLIKLDELYNKIVMHRSFSNDALLMEYLMIFLKPDGCLSIIFDDEKSAIDGAEEMFLSAAGSMTLIRDRYIINIKHCSKKNLVQQQLGYQIKEKILKTDDVSELFVRRLLRDFWLLVVQYTESNTGFKIKSVIDDRFWIDYGALRLWISEDARSSARVNLEGICYEHAYIGIQSVDYEERFTSYREKIKSFCESRGLLKSTDHFIGYAHLADLDLPSFSMSKMLSDRVYRAEFMHGSNAAALKIAAFISEIILNVDKIESDDK